MKTKKRKEAKKLKYNLQQQKDNEHKEQVKQQKEFIELKKDFNEDKYLNRLIFPVEKQKMSEITVYDIIQK